MSLSDAAFEVTDMKKGLMLLSIVLLCSSCSFLFPRETAKPVEISAQDPSASPAATERDMEPEAEMAWAPNAEGNTVETRIPAPEGFTRVETDGFGEFIRSQALLPDGSPVLLYDGSESPDDVHVAVFSMSVPGRDLQQCADAAIRLRAEYLYFSAQEEKIAFHLTNGFLMEWSKWKEGYRLKEENNETWWEKTEEPDGSYENLLAYLYRVFTYAGTLSLSYECIKVDEKDMRIGDMFLYGGSPGHCVIIADMAKNEEGETAFLLAQSNMPAQQVHILKNPLHDDPWYYISELTYPLSTLKYEFPEGSLVRFP